MRKSSLTVLLLVVAVNLLVWALFNRAQSEQDWEGMIRGVSFSPYQRGQDPFENKHPSADDIAGDLKLLYGKVAGVRTYTSTDGAEETPRLARRFDLRVTAGAWLDTRMERNDLEIRNLIRNARRYDNIDRLIVGNESLLRGDISVNQLIKYLREVRSRVNVPVSTAEPWHVWLAHPELAKEVDYIAIHILPYWEEVPNEQALGWVLERYEQIRQAFPGKHILIGEVGWPSDGNRLGASKPSLISQATFIRGFLNIAAQRHIDYYIMEAFDQPWKYDMEGTAGVHWGIFTVDRQPKFPMVGPVTENSWWPMQLAAATLLALLPMAWFLLRWKSLRMQGRLFYALLIQLTVSMLIWTAFTPLTHSLTLGSRVMWGVLLPAQLALLMVVLINGFELTETLWSGGWKRYFKPLDPARDRPLPMVSLHLAIYNEPPDMVIQTLNSLAHLDYPDFEVLVIDNNTKDDAVWKPVEAHCAVLGARFRFFHLPTWPGFKAGALNYGLTQTDARAEVIGVVDSDYIVQSNWLRALAPYFDNPKVGFVQAPQDNRGGEDDPFKEMINWEYNGFFQIGMMHRNERNAIIQHGTMTLIRRSALASVGNWGEGTICEDAELGLRLFHEGLEAVYVNHPFGHGLTPDSFTGYKKQRFRWAYGAMQIIRRYWRWLIPGFEKPGADGTGLTPAQKYHFISGWLPWFTDALHLMFTAMGVVWSVGLVLWPKYFQFPLGVFLIPTLGIFFFKVLHSFWLYVAKVPCSTRQRIGAAIAGMALTHTIARAVIQGLTTDSTPFLRTPKCESRPALIQGFLMAREEAFVLGLLWLATLMVLISYGFTPEALVWAVLLLVQSVPYVAALMLSLVNAVPGLMPRRARNVALVSQEK